MIELTTERLLLRPFTDADVDFVLDVYSRAEVQRYIGRTPRVMADRAEARPNEKQAYARAEIWRPHRGVAAHLLWGWYGAVRRGEVALEAACP